MHRHQDAAEDEAVDWIVAEANSHELKRELQRLKRRAQKRPILLLLVCLIGVSAVLRKVSKRVPIYRATIAMRVTEGILLDEESPVVREGLAHYLYTVALNTERLLPVIEKFDLYPARENFGDLHAIDQLRDALDIDVSINHFARARGDGDPVRSAGITIHFSNQDPALAFDVAQELSSVLVAAEQDRRGQMAEKLDAIADNSVTLVEERLADLKAKLALILLDTNTSKSNPAERARRAVQSRRLLSSVKETEFLLEKVSAIHDQTKLTIAVEGANQSLRFDVIDVLPPLIAPKRSLIAYCLLGLFVFLCLVPIAAIGLGALDTRLHHIEDLVRLDLPVVGHLPSFPSDRMGSMQERSREAKDVA